MWWALSVDEKGDSPGSSGTCWLIEIVGTLGDVWVVEVSLADLGDHLCSESRELGGESFWGCSASSHGDGWSVEVVGRLLLSCWLRASIELAIVDMNVIDRVDLGLFGGRRKRRNGGGRWYFYSFICPNPQ